MERKGILRTTIKDFKKDNIERNLTLVEFLFFLYEICNFRISLHNEFGKLIIRVHEP